MHLKKYYPTIVLGLIAVFGVIVIVYSTKNNPWGFTDAIAYLVSARNFSQGTGLGYFFPNGEFHYLTHYPPVYPLLLGLINYLTSSTVTAARWLDIVLFPGTLILSGLVFFRFSSKKHLGLAAAILIFCFEPMLWMSASAMSEPLFIFLSVAAGWCLLNFLKNGQFRWLVLAAFTASGCALTRYIGAAWIAAGFAGILLLYPNHFKQRLRAAMIFLTLSILPVILWFAWGYLYADNAVGGRSLNFGLSQIFEQLEPFRGVFITTVWEWLPLQLLLDKVRYLWRVIALFGGIIAITAGCILTYNRRVERKNEIKDFHIFSLFGMYAAFYTVLITVIYAFSSPKPDIDQRMLLPLFVGVVIAFLSGINTIASQTPYQRWAVIALWVVALLSVIEYSPENYQSVMKRPDYAGLLSPYWQHSPIVAEVAKLPPNTPVISNQPDVLLMWADHPAYYFGNFSSDFIQSPDPYGMDTNDKYQIIFKNQGAALVVTKDFYASASTKEGLSLERQVTLFSGLVISDEFEDGVIYYYSAP